MSEHTLDVLTRRGIYFVGVRNVIMDKSGVWVGVWNSFRQTSNLTMVIYLCSCIHLFAEAWVCMDGGWGVHLSV